GEPWHAHMALKRAEQGQRPATDGRDGGRLALEGPCDADDSLDERLPERRHHRLGSAKHGNADVAVALGLQMRLQLRENVLWILVGNEAEVNLGHGACRQHRLGPLATVAADEAGDVAGGREGLAPAQRKAGKIVYELAHAVRLPHLLV